MNKYSTKTYIRIVCDLTKPSGLFRIDVDNGVHTITHDGIDYPCSTVMEGAMTKHNILTFSLFEKNNTLFLNVHEGIDAFFDTTRSYLERHHQVFIVNSEEGIVITPLLDVESLIESGYNFAQDLNYNSRFVRTSLSIPDELRDDTFLIDCIKANSAGVGIPRMNNYGKYDIVVVNPKPELYTYINAYCSNIKFWVHYNPNSSLIPILDAYKNAELEFVF